MNDDLIKRGDVITVIYSIVPIKQDADEIIEAIADIPAVNGKEQINEQRSNGIK